MKLKIPDKIFGEPIEGAMERRFPKDNSTNPIIDPVIVPDTNSKNIDGYIYIPSINLYVSKERILQGNNWYNAHKELLKNNQQMLTIPQFIEFLKYTKTNNPEIYNDIIEVRDPWRAEWLDADFKVKNKKLYINYNHILDSKGNLIPKNLELLENCLMEDKTPGIDLESWLNNSIKQGLPKKDVNSGSLYYYCPMKDNNSVVGFVAGSGGASLDCSGNPHDASVALGVRPAKIFEGVK
ncbi:MAG: hypothetical protein PHF86_03530 [Candidatus Nanoarchaeia archaeon]|nr:hypothetical protein [Candidatus Nanoarchaeia archaeon]